MIQEKIFGNIGLNLDDDPRYFGEDDTDLIQNMLPDMDGDAGLLATHPGNTEIPTGIDWLITATQKVIGSCKRIENDTIYYFVKGMSIHGSDITTTTTTAGFDYDDALDNEYNSIIEFDPLTNTFRKIVFEEEFLYMGDWVYGAKVFGEYIIYNSGTHGIRKVHIEYAYRYYNAIPLPTYPTITSTTFALRNLPPMDRPTAVYSTDGAKLQNLLLGTSFQFAYRYKYVDGGYSIYSPYSDIYLPLNPELYGGEIDGSLYVNNKMTVSFVRGDLDMIEYVEIIVREGNDGDWRFLNSITDNVSTVDFYNDEKYESVDQDEVLKVEDAIPLQAADATLINDNRIVIAGVTEGFDNIEIDVLMYPEEEDVTIEPPSSGVISTHYIERISLPDNGYGIDTSGLNIVDYSDGDTMQVTYVYGTTYTVNYVLQPGDVDTLEHLVAQIVAQINGFGIFPAPSYVKYLVGAPSDAAAWNTGDKSQEYDIEIQTDGTYVIGGTSNVTFIGSGVVSSTNKWNTYKSDATHVFGIEYYDEEFRRSTVQRSSQSEVYVPNRGLLGTGNLDYRVFINWEINHMAPSWARYWRWVYAGNKTQSSFVQYVIKDTTVLPDDLDIYLAINIAPLQDLKTTDAEDVSFPKSIIDPYLYVPGDRVRIIAADDGAGDFATPYTGADYYDLPILGTSGDYILVLNPTAGTYGASHGTLIEIYTPRTFDEQNELYFPVGPVCDVVDGYHLGGTVDQSAGVAGSGTLESGDAYLIARAFSMNITGASTGDLFPVESMNWSDFYLSDDYDEGRPNIFSTIGEVTQNNIRWGNKHLSGASINNMFTFDALDYKGTTEIYGTITRIGEVGDVLKVLFQRKVASMYIGKSEFMDTNGSAVLSVSDNILSNPNYSIEDYGTTVPQAVIFIRGFCYFIDLYNGAIIRNGNNGSYPISGKVDAGGEGADYKMHRYFRDLCSTVLRDEDAYTMLLGWDDGRKLLYVSILGTAEERTLAFRESRGRWVCFLDFYEDLTGYYPTCYEWAGDKFYSFLNYSDSVWDHASATSTPLNIYGEAKTAYVNVWGQQHPNKVKVFDSISVHTDIKEWAGNVFIPVSLSYPNGMESRLPMAGFVRRENGLHAGYLFNALTDNGVFAPQRLYNGESLRGYMINNQLYTTEEAKLFKVDINFRISNL